MKDHIYLHSGKEKAMNFMPSKQRKDCPVQFHEGARRHIPIPMEPLLLSEGKYTNKTNSISNYQLCRNNNGANRMRKFVFSIWGNEYPEVEYYNILRVHC